MPTPSKRTIHLIGAVKATFIIAGAVLSTWPELAERIPATIRALAHGESLLGIATFALTLLLSLGACLLVGFFLPLSARIPVGALFSASAIFVTTYYYAMSDSLEVAQFEPMIAEIRFLHEAIDQYWGSFFKAVMLTLPLAIGIMLPAGSRSVNAIRYLRSNAITGATSILTILLIAALCWTHGGTGTNGYPAYLRPAAYWSAIALDNVMSRSLEPIPPQGVAVESEAAKKIVFVVDESVVSDVFGSDPSLRIDPRLGALEKYKFDFGAAASGANCSASSNRLLQTGPRFEHANQDLAKYPWIWEYAKKAGYTTIYIDAQDTRDILHNGMTARERAFIDQVIVANPGLVSNNDRLAGERLAKLVRTPDKAFIYINKVGAHFPYDSKYPATAAPYQPVLGIAGNLFEAHLQGQSTSLRSSLADNAGTIRFKNSYRNAVEWNLNSFFAAIQDDSWLRTGVLIYTSDHGQNIFRELGRTNTHCSSGTDAAPSEGRVPLFFMTGMPQWSGIFADAANRNYGLESHFNIFASLLAFMGYSSADRPDLRDPPVWSRISPPANFLHTYTELESRFGGYSKFITLCLAPSRLDLSGRCHP